MTQTYSMESPLNGRKYEIEKRVTDGKFEIVENRGLCGRWSNVMYIPTEQGKIANFWCNTPLFDSFIQAVKWLKENINDLL